MPLIYTVHNECYCSHIIIKQVQQLVSNMVGNVFLCIKCKIHQHLSLTVKLKYSKVPVPQCKVSPNHANFLTHHPLQMSTITPLLRPLETVSSTPVTYAREEGKACLCLRCDPSSKTGVQLTDTVLFKMTECRGSDHLHSMSCHCFRPVTLDPV